MYLQYNFFCPTLKQDILNALMHYEFRGQLSECDKKLYRLKYYVYSMQFIFGYCALEAKKLCISYQFVSLHFFDVLYKRKGDF